VPARVAVGFTPGRVDLGARTISTKDAHAWVEAYFPGYGWLTFDPTPLGDGRAVTPAYLQDSPGKATAPQPGERNVPEASVPGVEPEPAPAQPDAGSSGSTRPEPAGGTGSDQDKDGPDKARGGSIMAAVLTGLAIAFAVILLVAAPSIARRVARSRRRAAAARGGPEGAAAAWREVLAESRDRGGPVPGNNTVRTTARTLVRGHRLDQPSTHAVRVIVDAVEQGWYAPPNAGVPGHMLVDALDQAGEGFERAVPLRLPDRLWPRSVRPTFGHRTRQQGSDTAYERVGTG
jgi:hypothetical protein